MGVGTVCVDERRLSQTLSFLSVGFLVASILLLVLHYWYPGLGSLERGEIGRTTTGILHPGSVGEMTSIALLIIVGSEASMGMALDTNAYISSPHFAWMANASCRQPSLHYAHLAYAFCLHFVACESQTACGHFAAV